MSYKSEDLVNMAKSLNMPYLERIPRIEDDVMNIISKDVSLQHKIIAFERDKKKVKIGIVEPTNINALNILRFIAEERKLEIELYLISQEMFDDMFEQYSGGTEEAIKEVMEILQNEDDVEDELDNKKEDKEDKDSIQFAQWQNSLMS